VNAQNYTEKKKILKSELVTDMKEPVHKLCDIIIDGYEIPFAFNAKSLQDGLTTVHTQMQKLLSPHFTSSRIQQLDELFILFKNEDLEYDFFSKKKWTETKEVGTVLRELWDANII